MPRYKPYLALAIVAAGLALMACGDGDGDELPAPPAAGGATPAYRIEVTSPAFAAGETIPAKYTCDGEDVSPAISWRLVRQDPSAVGPRSAPAEVKSFALIADDPDAPGGTWTHWVVYGIPPGVGELREGVPSGANLSGGGRQGVNDFRRLGYGGPCPPRGAPHRYIFKVFALAGDIELDAGATKKELLAAMDGLVLYQGQLMGRYGR